MAQSNGLDIVKRPNVKTSYTDDMLLDLVQCLDDPMYFLKNFMKIQHPLKGAISFEPYPFQEKLIKGFHDNRFCVALTARQCGKSVTYQSIISKNGNQILIGDLIRLSPRQKIISFLERLLVKLAA